MAEQPNEFDPDETLPLPNDSHEKMEESKRLLALLDNPVDETASASLLSHLASLRESGWDGTSYQLVVRCFKLALDGGMEPILSKRMLTDGILPMASVSPPSRHTEDDDGTDDSDWVAKIVRHVIDELLSFAFKDASDTDVNMDVTNASSVNEAIKILLPTFLHRLDSNEACQSLSSIEDAALDGVSSLDDTLDKFCGYTEQCKVNAQVTAGLLSAIKEFDNLSTGRISKKRVWRRSSYGQDYTFEYVDRPATLIKMAISALETLASSKEPDALPPLVYQLAILPMGLIHGDSKVKINGENEKQRGMRLRKMVLEGIAMALGGDLDFGSTANKSNEVVFQGSNTKSDEWRWSRYTSLSHMGTCLRMDPEMSKAVLAMLGGEISSQDSRDNVAPFRYQRLTSFKLAMGLSMASSVPRMRQSALGCVRDLILEEEIIRIRCGLRRDGKRVAFGKPWMLCLVRCLEKVSSGDAKAWEDFQLYNEDGNIGHVLKCLIMVAQFANTSEAGGGSGSISAGSASMILQSLVTLGFLLIDCVKKDETSNGNEIQASSLLGSSLDVSILIGGGSCVEDPSATHATACTGRLLLSYLFYQSAVDSSHYMPSSLSRASSEGGTSLCRLILKTTVDKLCSMAPNAFAYGKVLIDLMQFSPVILKSIHQDLEADFDGLDDKQKGEVNSLAMATHHIPMLIDTLSNIPGGGMNTNVAISAVIPAIGNLLLLQASAGALRPGLAGYLWKKNDVIDHVDHAYLLAKKSLYAIDEDKRKCAAKMLCFLIGTAVIGSSGGNKRTMSKWAPALDELRSSLRRCLTQYQQSIRMEVYSTLMALLPDDMHTSSASQTQESVSPKSTTSAASQSPNQRSSLSAQSFIPPAAKESFSDMVCRILSSQLERFISTPPEHIQDKRARQQRGHAMGSQLSQIADVDQSQESENSMPFRFETLISTRPTQTEKSQGKSKKAIPIAQALLNEALSRINEPLGFLIASCNAACLGAAESDISNDLKNQSELKDSIISLRIRMSKCNDIELYLKWLKSNKNIFEQTNNAKRKEEMAVSKLATLIVVAVAAEALLGTCIDAEVTYEFIGVETTNEDVENLFNLRHDSVTRASEILSSFVSSKPKKKKKLEERDANAEEPDQSKKKKKSNRPNKDDDENMECNEDSGLVTTTEINRSVQAKNKRLLEDAIDSISPALPMEFLSGMLRKFGAKVETELNKSEESDDEDDSNAAITKRLARCVIFRRFIITKCTLLVGGAKVVVKAGSPFASLRKSENVNGLIASSLSIGQQLFTEFCSSSYQLERTSLSADTSGQELPLSQLALRGFALCVSGMTSDAPHGLSRAGRVNAILGVAKAKAQCAVPSLKESWDHYNNLNISDSSHQSTSNEELVLKKALLPFISHDSSSNRLCLFEELLIQSMHGEAMECSNVVLAAASVLTDANLMEHLGVVLLKCYERVDGERVGVLGLDFGEEEECVDTFLAHVVDIGFRLSRGLDGDTHAPIPPALLGSKASKGSTEERPRFTRAQVGLPTTCIENWPSSHRERLKKELAAPASCGMGIAQKIAWALTVKLGYDDRFDNTFGPESPSKGDLKLRCLKTVSKTTTSNYDREKSNISQTIISSIERSLDDTEYIVLKLIPNLSEKSLHLAQSFVACSLLALSKVISASAPAANSVDKGTFASSLLKTSKRLYSILVRFILSYAANPKSISCKETKTLLDFVTSTLVPRIAALLVVLQEKQESADGKYLAESKIESHGKTAAALVFEKEKLDNALLKMVSNLKQAGLKEESEWVGKHVVTSTDTIFNIHNVSNAQKREAPKKKGSKRKVEKDPDQKKKKKKKVKVKKETDHEDADDDASREDVGSDEESEAVTCEVVASDTEDEDEDEEEDNEEIEVDVDRIEDEESEEEEAEFE